MTNENNETFLSVKNLTVEYVTSSETVHAVNNVSFDLKKGKTLGLVGETGAGKTTIAKAILKILPVPPAVIRNGEVLLEGRDLMKASEEDMYDIRGNKVTMIFQDPMTALDPVMTIGQQIEEVIQLHSTQGKQECRKQAEGMLEMVGIPAGRYNEYPQQFSGGMRQRVVIAIALACNPDLLLADEPTTALDVTIQSQVLDLISKLNRTKQTSMILITHDLGVVAEMCDDVAVVYAGEIVESGTLADVFKHPHHPYTKGLFGSIPHIDDDSERLNPIKGLPPNPTELPKGCKFNPRCPYATDACRNAAIQLREITPGHFCRCIMKGEEKTENG